MLIGFAFGLSSSKVAAATKEISEISPGSVVSVNGVKFVKLNNNNQFVAVTPSICPNFATGMYMQDFTSSMCANAPTPSGTDYFPIGVLTDRRDSKKYEVRKFADGNCWMVDNLAYGGSDLNNGEDGCLKTTFCGYGYNTDGTCITAADNATSTVDRIAPGLYGDCRYPYDNLAIVDANNYGYFYNWQAAVQDANAYYGNDYQPSQPTQGICPDGWYLPTGGANGQFQSLHASAGSPVAGFWQSGGNWQGVYAGWVSGSIVINRELQGYFWSSTQYSGNNESSQVAFDMRIVKNGPNSPDWASIKNAGLNVRCLKTP